MTISLICTAWALSSSEAEADSSGIGGHALGDLVHLDHGFVDLIDTLGLLLRGGRYLADQAPHLAGRFGDLFEACLGFVHQDIALLDPFDRAFHQSLSILGRLSRPHGQRSDLVGHHGEPGPGFSGPGRLKRRR